MAGNITLTMIKPMAVHKGFIVPILDKINKGGFQIIALKMVWMNKPEARVFYKNLKDKPFFNSLIRFMTSGPIVVAILRKENAVEEYRKLIGSTDPKKAEVGTIRREYASSIEKNAVHGSDSDENAIIESDFFFSKIERFGLEDLA
ncbi:MAG TPA: nucleoside-diphosphate kinase [Bacteroidales bacterium]|nr:MAG: nucleoside-diphosphate kinase [Bacteroidetes bacterium GWF2_33_38]HBF87795.1 nucleoside-diphosphate kinase [Bacteroidales bacterium]